MEKISTFSRAIAQKAFQAIIALSHFRETFQGLNIPQMSCNFTENRSE